MKTFLGIEATSAHQKMALAIAEVKARKNPNDLVDIVLEALCAINVRGVYINSKILAVFCRLALKKNLPGHKFTVKMSSSALYVSVGFSKAELTREQVREALKGLIWNTRDGGIVSGDHSVSLDGVFVQEWL